MRIVTGDVRDEFAINKLIRKNTDVVINLAALIDPIFLQISKILL